MDRHADKINYCRQENKHHQCFLSYSDFAFRSDFLVALEEEAEAVEAAATVATD